MGETYDPRRMLERLVAFPTVSRDTNLPLIDFVRSYLAGWGVESVTVPSPCGRKASLYAQVGPAAPGGVILSGHTDVVPVDGQAWSSDPFTLVEREGRLYGRGACDMKGFLALVLALAPDMLRAGLRRPIQIALSYDEEVGCLAAPALAAAMRAALPPAAVAVIGEPTGMGVVSAHKGALGLVTTVTGHEVHSSLVHRGVSAVMAAARLIEWHRVTMERNRLAAEARGEASPFDPPWTTLHVGKVSGGTAANITARECVFTSDFRLMPGETPAAWLGRYRDAVAEVEADMRAVHPAAGVSIAEVPYVPPLAPEGPSGAAESLARALTGDNAERAVAYVAEAGQFQAAGYSSVIVGPGSIAQAHQPDEFIELSQLAAGETFLRRLIDRLAA